MLLLFLFLAFSSLPLSAQAGGDGRADAEARAGADVTAPALIRLPDVTLRGAETALLSPPPPLRPLPLYLQDLSAARTPPGRSESPVLRPGTLPAAPQLVSPELSFITPGSQVRGFTVAATRAPGQVCLTYVPRSQFAVHVRNQAAAGNWDFIPELSLTAGDIWLSPDQEPRSRLYAGLSAVRAYEALALRLQGELGHIGSGADAEIIPFGLVKAISWRQENIAFREETRLVGSRQAGPGSADFSPLLAESLAVEADADPLGSRISLQTFVTLKDGSSSLQTGLEAVAFFPVAGLTLEAGAALRYHRAAWKILPGGRIRYAPGPGVAFRVSAEPFLSLPEAPGFLIRNASAPSPAWQPEAGYRIASGALLTLCPGLEADLLAAYRWGSFYEPWLFVTDAAAGTLTGRLLYRADSRLRFHLLAGFDAPGDAFVLSAETLKAGLEIDFNKPPLTFILELLWGHDPYTEPDPVLSAWGAYFSGTAVSLKTDWYLGARHILTQGLYYTTTGSSGEFRFLLGYGIRIPKE